MTLSREEFEDWLEDHRDEALDRIEAGYLPLTRWVTLYAKSLRIEADEEGESEEDTSDDEPDDDLDLDEDTAEREED